MHHGGMKKSPDKGLDGVLTRPGGVGLPEFGIFFSIDELQWTPAGFLRDSLAATSG